MSLQTKDFFSVPIHIFLLAEVLVDQELIIDCNELSIYSLYEKFVMMKLKIWSKKGPLAAEDNEKLQQSYPPTKLLQFFHKLALKQLLDVEELAKLDFLEISENVIDEMIARVGIVAYGPEKVAQFTHRTLAEYFVADFILKNVLIKSPQASALKLFLEITTNPGLVQVQKFMNDRFKNSDQKLESDALTLFVEKTIDRQYCSGGNFFRYLEEFVKERQISIVVNGLTFFTSYSKDLKETIEKLVFLEFRKFMKDENPFEDREYGILRSNIAKSKISRSEKVRILRSVRCYLEGRQTDEKIISQLKFYDLSEDAELVEAIKRWDFERVRKFMSRNLNSAQKNKMEALAKYMEETNTPYYEYYETHEILERAVEEKNTHLITFVLKTLKFEAYKKLILVKKVLFKAIECFEVIAAIFNSVDSFLDESEIKTVTKIFYFKENVIPLEMILF